MLVAVALMSTVAGCGSQTGRPAPAAAGSPTVRDVVTLRRAAEAGSSDEAVAAVSALLRTARSQPGDREGWKGSALIRAQLPSIMTRFLSDYSRTRKRLSAVRTRTRGGAAIKAWLLRTYADQRSQLLRLSADVSKSTYTWGAVLRWGGENNAAIARFDRSLAAILRTLPVAERRSVDRAIRG